MRTAARLCAELAGFAALLFVTRFLARAHLVPQMEQECHIGGIAVDVLAHGVRFPLLAYAPNEYDNGSFFSGLLAAVSFSLLGRSVLSLKLVTHVISAAGAVATLWLLRACLQEMGLTSRRVRWAGTTALVVAIALAPRVVTLCSMNAVGNHAEGAAIDAILLALFSRNPRTRSATRTAALWFLVGFALYLNKGTFLVIPVLAAAEIAIGWRSPARLAAAFAGLVVGALPELLVIAQQEGMGWTTMASKAERGSHAFPHAFLDSILTLGEHRLELMAVWALAIVAGCASLLRSRRRFRRGGSLGPLSSQSVEAPPVTLRMVLGFTCLHLAALTVMAAGGLDAYVLYGYPTLVVLFSVLVATISAHAEARWGKVAGAFAGAAAVAIALFLHRPDRVSWGGPDVAALWRNRAGAACFWRFAEGFEREHEVQVVSGLAPPGRTREEHAIERCRSFSEEAQILDCIGGIARELNWRQRGRVAGQPPAGLSAAERRAYAYYYGSHRRGDATACSDFRSPSLAADCVAAIQLECLIFGDTLTRFISGYGLGAPTCTLPEPPMDGYWAAMRLDLLTRTTASTPTIASVSGENDLTDCRPVFDACY